MAKPTFEIVNLGVHHPDYFQGFGTSFTPFKHCTYGIGDTAEEAYQDALEMMYQGESVPSYADEMPALCPFSGSVPSGANSGDDTAQIFYHVGIRWNT